MAGGQRRKCNCCRRLFRPDPRNRLGGSLQSREQGRKPGTLAREAGDRDPWHVALVMVVRPLPHEVDWDERAQEHIHGQANADTSTSGRRDLPRTAE